MLKIHLSTICGGYLSIILTMILGLASTAVAQSRGLGRSNGLDGSPGVQGRHYTTPRQ